MYNGHQSIICEGNERIKVDMDKTKVTIRVWPKDTVDTGGVSLILTHDMAAVVRHKLNNLTIVEEN